MATRFEIALHGGSESVLRAAGEEALNEIDRLESQLSLYRPGSEIAQINARAAREPVAVSPEVFDLLKRAQILSAETDGAFDITVAPLVRCWGFMGPNRSGDSFPSWEGSGVGSRKQLSVPSQIEIAAACKLVGMDKIILDASHRTVRFAREGMMLDLGAIGKGYAIERAAEILREAGVENALLHGGTSTVCAMGSAPDGEWKVAVNAVETHVVKLRNESLSVSAIWGRCFEADGKIFGHVIDPRAGRPVCGTTMAAVVLPSATETDAFSTALLILGRTGHRNNARLRANMRTLLLVSDCSRLESHGF